LLIVQQPLNDIGKLYGTAILQYEQQPDSVVWGSRYMVAFSLLYIGPLAKINVFDYT